MGMFDIVMVPCPECGTDNEFQSKGGYCHLLTYTLDTVPVDVLSDVNRHAPYECSNCGHSYSVENIEPKNERSWRKLGAYTTSAKIADLEAEITDLKARLARYE